jgi:hypothetical protein
VRHGASELSTSLPDVTLAALRLRKGAQFIYTPQRPFFLSLTVRSWCILSRNIGRA